MKEIVINYNKKNYHLQNKEVYSGDSLHRYEISAGDKVIILERRKREKIFDRRWKLISVNWNFKDNQTAAFFIHEIMKSIDDELNGKR